MRTTLTLDRDVATRLKTLTGKSGRPLKQVVNDALRAGLPALEKNRPRKRHRTKPINMGRPRIPLDNIGEVLAYLDGEDRL